MSVIPFLAALVCMGLIIFWYVQDESTRGGKARTGLLKMGEPTDDRKAGAPDWKPHGTRPWKIGK